MAEFQDILFDFSEGVATIQLNRPEASNSYTPRMKTEIIEAVSLCSVDEAVRVVMLTGRGRHFCAGGNLQEFKKNVDSGKGFDVRNLEQAAQLSQTIRFCKKPVVACVNGSAVGAGAALAFASDFRVMTPSSKLISGFARMGVSGDSGSFYYMSRLIGMARATEFYMLGQSIGGDVMSRTPRERSASGVYHVCAANLKWGGMHILRCAYRPISN